MDRSFYEPIDLRVAMHPSESETFLLTRVLAYALNYESGLEFSQGLSTPDEPAIRLLGSNGRIARWIDIGNPLPRRIHKASKAADSVRIYTYKDPENLKREASREAIHRKELIEIFALEPRFLESLAQVLKRDNSWAMIHNDGELVITADGETFMTSLTAHRLEMS